MMTFCFYYDFARDRHTRGSIDDDTALPTLAYYILLCWGCLSQHYSFVCYIVSPLKPCLPPPNVTTTGRWLPHPHRLFAAPVTVSHPPAAAVCHPSYQSCACPCPPKINSVTTKHTRTKYFQFCCYNNMKNDVLHEQQQQQQ